MQRTLPLVLLLGALAACGSSDGDFTFGPDPVDPVDPVPEEPSVPGNGVPEIIGANLESATYTPGGPGNPDGALLVRVTSLDSTPQTVSYARNRDLEVGVDGYDAYSVQEDPLDRFFTGFAARSTDGSIDGVLVQDGGQFNTFFGGVSYVRQAEYSPHVPAQPDRGLVSYAGEYVGMLNGGDPNATELLPVDPTVPVDPSLLPGQALRVTGDVFINADFTDNTVNGAVYDRQIVGLGAVGELDAVTLTPTDIDGDGRFEGAVQVAGVPGEDIGDYAGAFGGTGATAVAGGLRIENFIDDTENEIETGLFVLDQCGQPDESPVCGTVDP